MDLSVLLKGYKYVLRKINILNFFSKCKIFHRKKYLLFFISIYVIRWPSKEL